MKAGRNAGNAEIETSSEPILLRNLFEEHRFVGRGLQPVQGLVHGMEDLKIFLVGTHGLELARYVERGITRNDDGALGTGGEDLALESLREGFHRILVKVSADEVRKIYKVGVFRPECGVALEQMGVREHIFERNAPFHPGMDQLCGGVDLISNGHLSKSLSL